MNICYVRERQRFIAKINEYRETVFRSNPQKVPPTLPINRLFCEKDTYYLMCGIINTLWQEWNKQCKKYWEIFIFGGYLSTTINITAVVQNPSTYNESLYTFLDPTNRKYNRYYGKNKLILPYNEPTWGCYNSLSEIGSYYVQHYPEISNMLGALSLYGTDVKHVQIVRNSCAHLDKYTMNDIRQIESQYSLGQQIKYPSDLSFATSIGSGQVAFSRWCDSLTAIVNRM